MASSSYKFAQLFTDANGIKYLFKRTVGSGVDSIAQEVVHTQTKESFVRKVNRKPEPDEFFQQPDREEQVLTRVQTELSGETFMVRINSHQDKLRAPTTPKTAQVSEQAPEEAEAEQSSGSSAASSSSDSAPDANTSPNPKPSPDYNSPPRSNPSSGADSSDPDSADQRLYLRSSMLQLYNGGDLMAFMRRCTEQGLRISRTLILRFIFQVATAFSLMFSMIPPVLHNDFHPGQIFVHWETQESTLPSFYVGDFGNALHDAGQPARTLWEHATRYAKTLLKLARELFYMPGRAVGDFDDPRHEAALARVLRFNNWFGDVWTDLLAQVPMELTLSSSDDLEFRESVALETFDEFKTGPKLYDTAEEARTAYDVVGPWKLAKVDELGNVIWVSEEVYGGVPPDLS